jgi:hypothetical protein
MTVQQQQQNKTICMIIQMPLNHNICKQDSIYYLKLLLILFIRDSFKL